MGVFSRPWNKAFSTLIYLVQVFETAALFLLKGNNQMHQHFNQTLQTFTYSTLIIFFKIIHIQQINLISKIKHKKKFDACLYKVYLHLNNYKKKYCNKIPWKFPKILCFTIINIHQHLFWNNSASFTVQYF